MQMMLFPTYYVVAFACVYACFSETLKVVSQIILFYSLERHAFFICRSIWKNSKIKCLRGCFAVNTPIGGRANIF